jgi:hypothetical protein
VVAVADALSSSRIVDVTDAEADEYLRYAVNGEAVAEMKKDYPQRS